MFQSAPDQLIGRYIDAAVNQCEATMFQSAPDQLIGRYSILSLLAGAVESFNPRPTN